VPKNSKNEAQKKRDRDRQVGAFSVFGLGHTGIPFIFCCFFAFFRFFCRFRGWCNTTPVRPGKRAAIQFGLGFVYRLCLSWSRI